MRGRGDEGGRRDRRGSGRYGRLETKALVRLMRDGDHLALSEFVRRYRGLLMSYAERFGVLGDDARTLVMDVLEDVALHLMHDPEKVPRSMDAYVVASFRNQVLKTRRDALRSGRPAIDTTDTPLDAGPGDLDAPGGSSQAMLRAAKGPAWEPAPLNPALERLITMLDSVLTTEERRLLSWVSEYVPQSEIAQWSGISHAAIRKQVERLRHRLAATAKLYAASLSVRERAELMRFFRRAKEFVIDHPDPANPSRRATGNG
jgi:DNA-directed RNA polymerase specialized sigma24 family protein